MSAQSKKILFLLPFTLNKAPSQRFRAEAYFPLLRRNGYQVNAKFFYSEEAWKILYGSGSAFAKAWIVTKGFLKRTAQVLFVVPFYDFVFIQREASPLGPPIFEWITTKIWRKKLIFDFDDAIWIPNNSSDNRLLSWLKAFWKAAYLCRWAYKVSAGNDYLAEYARQHSNRVEIIPTVIDTEKKYLPATSFPNTKPVVGWTGSHSTLKYLHLIEPLLVELEKQIDFSFLVIADKKPELSLKAWSFVPWNAETEIADLQQLDIGVMPLTADPWSEGKCGFKLIQYLGLGIPAVASPVGVNKTIIAQGENGFLAGTEVEWKNGLLALLTEPELRKKFGRAGRKKIEAQYSLSSQEKAFLSLFATN